MFFSDTSTWRFSPTVPKFPLCSLSSNRCTASATGDTDALTDQDLLVILEPQVQQVFQDLTVVLEPQVRQVLRNLLESQVRQVLQNILAQAHQT